MGLLEKLIGRWRLWRGYCPACNLDAPAIDTCPVCHGFDSAAPTTPWPPGHMQLELWRRKWLRLDAQKHEGQ
jgi:hypothetical protein